MTRSVSSRRRFLQGSAGLLAGSALTPYIFTANAEEAAKPRSKNDRFGIGAIGMWQGPAIRRLSEAVGSR